MKTTKSFLITLLALFASFTANAADGDTFRIDVGDDEDHLWLTMKVLSEADKTVEVQGTDHAWGTADIPATTEGYTVVSIGNNAFKNQTDLVLVIIPNTVTSIGNSAFAGCTGLGANDNTIVIPESVTSIGQYAFDGCAFFNTTIPTTVTHVGDYAFRGTAWLNNQPEGVVYINNMVYTYKGEMPANTSITITEGTTAILAYAFKDCSGLTSVTIPATVTEIGSQAFDGCSNLTSVTVANPTPISIYTTTFSNAANATLWVPNFEAYNAYRADNSWSCFRRITASISFADETVKNYCVQKWDTDRNGELEFDEAAAVTQISGNFNNLTISSFDEFKYFTGVTVITSGTSGIYPSFKNCTIGSLTIPSNVKTITGGSGSGEMPFAGTKISKLIICDGDDVLTISVPGNNSITGMFKDSKLSSLYLGRNYTLSRNYIGEPFSTYTLEELTLGRKITTIRDGAFGGCNLMSITIPSNVTSIGGSAFSSSLREVVFENGDATLTLASNWCGSSSYNKTNTIYLGRPISSSSTFSFSSLTKLNTLYITNNYLSDALFSDCSTLKTVEILGNIQTIPQNAFKNCISINHVEFPNSLKNIGTNAFQSCTSLTSVNLPEGMVSIGGYAFEGCTSLNSVSLPSGMSSIGEYAFQGCTSLNPVSIPSGMSSIGERAFSNCTNLNSVQIGEGLQSIGAYAFSNCSKLKTITIPASVSIIGDYSFPSNILVHLNNTVPTAAFSVNRPCLFVVPNNSVTDYQEAWPDVAVYIIGQSDFAEKSYTVTAQASSSALVDAIGEENILSVVKLKVSGTINSYDMMVMRNKLVNLRELDLSDVSIVANSYNYGTGVSEDNVFPDFLKTTSLTSLILPNTITKIGNSALRGTPLQLESINIPVSVTSIGEYAFASSSVKVVNFEDNSQLQSIGNSAFKSSNIETINLGDNSQLQSIGNSAFVSSKIETINLVDNSKLETIGDSAFYNCAHLQNIPIPASLKSIGKMAFSACHFTDLNLQFVNQVDISEKAFNMSSLVTAVIRNGGSLNKVFMGCPNLESIDIDAKNISYSSSTTSYGEFYDCQKLKNVIIRLSSGGIYTRTFFRCPIENLTIKCTIIRDDAFSMDNVGIYNSSNNRITTPTLKSVIIEEGVVEIGARAFNKQSELISSNLTLPESLTTIGESAFYGCSNLTGELVLPRKLTSISNSAFSSCKFSSIKLSPNTTTIGTSAFAGTMISEIRLPSTLTSISDGAFGSCGNLKAVYAYMPDIIPIAQNTFYNYQTSTLYVPSFLYNSYYYDTNWSKFLHVLTCDLQPGDYETFYTNGDIFFADGDERITTDTPIATIGSQGSITVEGEAQAFDTVDQTVEDSYSASLIGDGTTAADNNIPMNELRVNITVAAKKWYFFCFPFNVTIAECTYPGRYAWRSYDGATRAASGSGGWKVVSGTTLNAYQGYAFQSETAGTLIVRCAAPTFGGNRPQSLTVHAATNAQNASWNFVGNPYSSYYDFGTADITSPITVWNGSSYTAYRPGDDELHLRPYQAFFIQKPEAANSIQFNAGRRESYRQSLQTAAARAAARKAEGKKSDRQFLNITISDNDTAAIDRTRLVLNEKASHSYELECDAAKFLSDDAAAQVYLVEDGTPMAIDERPAMGDICLGYVAKSEGTLRLEAERMDVQMVLYDNETGKEFNLANGAYEFTTAAGTFNHRFTLRTSGEASAISSLTKQAGVAISTIDGGLNIADAEGKTVEVYTVGGSLVTRQDGNGTVSLTPGIYVVKVNGVSTKVRVN